MAAPVRRPRRKKGKTGGNFSTLLSYLAPCGKFWLPSIDSFFHRTVHRLAKADVARSGVGAPSRRALAAVAAGRPVGPFEPYIFTQCVADADYGDRGDMDKHRGRIFGGQSAYAPAAWAPGAFHKYCRGCRLPLHQSLSRDFTVARFQNFWTFESGAGSARDAAAAAAAASGAERVSIRATKVLRRHLHSTQCRGPWVWVPWMEMFDWLVVQWNPKLYDALEKVLRLALFRKWPPETNLPFVGAFVLRQRQVPRTIFITTPVLPYFMKFIMPLLPDAGVAIYLDRGWADAWPPRQWLQSLADDYRVLHVFAENPRKRHPKVTPMPTGIDPLFLAWHSGEALRELRNSIRMDQRIVDRVGGSWADIGPYRRAASAFFRAQPWFDWIVTPGEYGGRQVAYWRRISEYAFTVSPPAAYHGEGPKGPLGELDSYRTFEALALRSIPILLAGPNAWAWQGLPVVLVKNWTEVTPSNLRRWWKDMRHLVEGEQPYLRSSYWWAKIERVVNASGVAVI